jgi:hypothetical protein
LSLTEKFDTILKSIGISNRYEPVDYDDLDSDTQAKIDGLNLKGILQEQIQTTEPLDALITRFVLRRLTQLDDDSATELVLNNIRRVYPVFKDAIAYLTGIRSLRPVAKHAIGARLLDLVDDDIVGHLEYHRAWILSAFAQDAGWSNAERFVPIFNSYDDPLTRREVILALGWAGKSEWFKSHKRSYDSFDPWQKRAFLAAASCLPGDEADHWYRSIAQRLDPLEKAVVNWVLANPFRHPQDSGPLDEDVVSDDDIPF